MKGVKGSKRKDRSKCCVRCGEEWLEDLSNKQAKRALCLKCAKLCAEEYNQKHKLRRYKMHGSNRTEKYKNFKMDVRKSYWKEINEQLRNIKDRNEWKRFIAEKMEGVLNNIELMDYINDTNINSD